MAGSRVLVVSPKGPDSLGRMNRLKLVLESFDCDVTFLCKSSRIAKFEARYVKTFLHKIAYILRGITWGKLSVFWHKLLINDLYSEFLNVYIKYDIIFIEHVDFIYFPEGLNLKGRKLIFDVKDYFPRNFEDNFVWRILVGRPYRNLFNNYLSYYTSIISVSDHLKRLLLDEYGFDSIVIPNSAAYYAPKQIVSDGEVHYVYSGSCSKERGVYGLIAIFKELFNLKLHLYLIGSIEEISRLQQFAAGYDNISFENVVTLNNIVNEISKYDVFIINFNEDNLNNRYSLPNKFYEAVQARLLIISTPCEAMAEIITDFRIGFIAKSFGLTDLKIVIESITRKHCFESFEYLEFAASALSFENYSNILRKVIIEN